MKTNKIRELLVIACMVLPLLALPFMAGCPAPAQPEEVTPTPAPSPEVIHWRCQNYGEPGAAYYEDWGPPFADLVYRMSNGRLDIEMAPGGAIVSNFELMQSVAKGTLDMAITCPLYHTGIVAAASLEYGAPGIYQTPRDVRLLARRFGLLDILRDAYAEKGVYLLGLGSDSGLTLFTNKPFKDLDDLREFKIRVGGGMGAALSKAGVAVTMIPGGEIYTAMSEGVIDGVVYGSPFTANTIGVPEVATHVVWPPLQAAHNCTDVIVNMDRWESLPADLKAILEAACWAFFPTTGNHGMYEDAAVVREFVEKGGEAVDLSDKDRLELANYSLEWMDELAEEDPEHSGKAVELIKEYRQHMGYPGT